MSKYKEFNSSLKLFPLFLFFILNFLTVSSLGLIPENTTNNFYTINGTEVSFLNLNDTPSSYSGEANNCIAVNSGQTGLEFVSCGGGGGSGSITGAGTLNYIPMWNGTHSLNNSIIYQSGTNVGINTTSPNYKLEVINDLGTAGVPYQNFEIARFGRTETGIGLTLGYGTRGFSDPGVLSYASVIATGSSARLALGVDSTAVPSILVSSNGGVQLGTSNNENNANSNVVFTSPIGFGGVTAIGVLDGISLYTTSSLSGGSTGDLAIQSRFVNGNKKIGFVTGDGSSNSTKLIIGTNTGVTIQNYPDSTIPFIVQGHATQTADLQNWQDSSGNTLIAVNGTGTLIIGTSANPKNITMYSPDGTSWSCGVNNGGSFTCN
jgi:hypothetical protein